jgi:hypothetical protein
MSKLHTFRWNPYADQPHNIAPKSERFVHHLRHIGSYVSLLGSNITHAAPVLRRYADNRRHLFGGEQAIDDPFGLAVTPLFGRLDELQSALSDLGIRKVLVRIPSWEREKLPLFEEALRSLRREGREVVAALLQNRDDVLDPDRWASFLGQVFGRLGGLASHFEIGHAWNRTKWGVWEHGEYMRLAEKALALSRKYGVKIIGPAVIDFEFHLYPPILKRIPFDVFTSLLYVDRAGAPENRQVGWDLAGKAALLKAVVDTCGQGRRELWVTEMNWPLKGTGRYSPVSGRPNVTEKSQADYLVRYHLILLASGFVSRIYWWQMVAPGYGLMDSRGGPWRKRPSYFALKHLAAVLRKSRFLRRIPCPGAHLFLFTGEKGLSLAAWTTGPALRIRLTPPAVSLASLTGRDISLSGETIPVEESPKYIGFPSGTDPESIRAVPGPEIRAG